MVTFDWFIFRPLNLQEFLSHFKVDIALAEKWYVWWSDEYKRLEKCFYIGQYNRHELLEFREFSRVNSLGIRFPEDLEESNDAEHYYESWKQWRNESKLLQEHREAVKILLQQHFSPPISLTLSELFQEDEEMFKQGWNDQNIESAKALWFNSNITLPSNKDLKNLKSIPYPDYLKTSHWRKVRAAMMLIEQARCKECDIDVDSFYGADWETEIQVHHLHYRNRGHERYEDLRLLCREHHEKAHSI